MNSFLRKFWLASFSILAIIQGSYSVNLFINYHFSRSFFLPIVLSIISIYLVFIYFSGEIATKTLQYVLFSIVTFIYLIASIIFTSCLIVKFGCNLLDLISFLKLAVIIFIPTIFMLGILVKFSKK